MRWFPPPEQLSGDLTGLTSSKRDPATGAAAILDPLTRSFASRETAFLRQEFATVTKNFIAYTPQPNANVGWQKFCDDAFDEIR